MQKAKRTKQIRLIGLIGLIGLISLTGCGKKSANSSSESGKVADLPTEKSVLAFSADSAYQFIADQVDFGPRVPGTPAHEACARYLKAKLASYGAITQMEQGQLINYAGENQQICNIVGRFNPELKRRILLCAHWDCRPWSDQEENYDLRKEPVLGANDGASGVGVLLEVARQLQNAGNLGIDIVFFDVEDMGTPSFYTGKEREDTWCLGSQLWAQQRVLDGTNKDYRFGILLDMVGSPDATFPKEYYSKDYARAYTEKIWRTAQQLGYGRLFRDVRSYPLTDDHYYVNTIADIPCVDVIHYDAQSGTGFAHYWHTQHDDMSNISKATLDAVGKTVLAVIQNEYAGNK